MKIRLDAAIGFVIVLIVLILLNGYGIIPFDLLTFLVFIAILGALIFNDRKNVKLEGIIFIRRTTKGKRYIDNVAKKRPGFWSKMALLGIVIGIIGLVIGTAFLTSQAYDIAATQKEGGVKLLLPGPVSQPVNAPGIFIVPWWIWVICITFVIIPHEFFHGIMCRLDNIKIKSVGWLLLAIIPGAFVEPDEKQLKKAKRTTKLKVYAAGSFANILVAIIILLFLTLSFPLLFSSSGVFVQAQANNSGFTVYEINGFPIKDRADFLSALSNYSINETVKLKVAPGGYVIPKFAGGFIPESVMTPNMKETALLNVTLTRDPSTIQTMQVFNFAFGWQNVQYYHGLVILLLWIYMFSLGVGLVNLLPIKPLDGGLIFEEIAGRFTKRAKLVTKIVSIIVFLILLFNLVGPIFMGMI